MQAQTSIRVPYTSTTPPLACLLNAASAHLSISTGKERDAESGNDYFGARYYASSMGRFLSPDPSVLDYADPTNPQSLNLYSYARNNPLINIDPTGLDCVTYVGTDTGPEGQTVIVTPGDCPNESEDASNHEYYVNCDGCAYNAAGASWDTPTGTITFTDQNGKAVTDDNGNAAAIQGFFDPLGTPATSVTVNGDAPYLDTISGFGVTSGLLGTAPNNPPGVPTPPNPILKYAQCRAQVRAKAHKNRTIIEVAAGVTIENTSAACLLAGPGAAECLAVVEPVVLINSGIALAAEWDGESQEEAACAQQQ